MEQLLLNIQPPPKPSFDNFKLGKNAEAIINIREAIQGDAPSRFVYIWGEAGSGKSHLLTAARFYGAETQDDVHELDEDAQIKLFNRFNDIKEIGGTLITAGTHAPTQMGLRDDLATRLAWGLVYQLHPLSDQEKAEALQAHAEERGMKLPLEVIAYCLRNLRRDLPYLMSVVDALDKKPITIPMLKKLLGTDGGSQQLL